MIRALVFDFDGVLLDTEPMVLRSWQECYAAHGREVPLARWLTTVGTCDAPWGAAYAGRGGLPWRPPLPNQTP